MTQWESGRNTTFYLVYHLFLCKIHVISFILSAMFQNIFPEIINIVYFYLKSFFLLINFLLIESSFSSLDILSDLGRLSVIPAQKLYL